MSREDMFEFPLWLIVWFYSTFVEVFVRGAIAAIENVVGMKRRRMLQGSCWVCASNW